MNRIGLPQRYSVVSRRSVLVLVICLSILACLLAVSHELAITRLRVSEGKIAMASATVRPYVVISHPVEDWERDLYNRFKAERLAPWQLGNELSKMWGISLRDVDVDAWRERMDVDASSLELFGVWFWVPSAGILRSFYRAYGEYVILLGASAYVAYYAYLKPLLGQRGVGARGETHK